MLEATTSAETPVGQRQGRGYGAQQPTRNTENGGSTVMCPSVVKVGIYSFSRHPELPITETTTITTTTTTGPLIPVEGRQLKDKQVLIV